MSGTKNDSKNKEEKPHVSIGTLGQEGHGKTTLTAAIFWAMEQDFPTVQGIDYDRINEVYLRIDAVMFEIVKWRIVQKAKMCSVGT